MKSLPELFAANARWAEQMVAEDPAFFTELEKLQSPKYVWIGCSDSRVPANQITGLKPGEVFVHRNVGNVVVHTDLNCLSVLQYAIDVLRVQHVIVCGHYGCGAIQATLAARPLGLIDAWLRNIEDVAERHRDALSTLSDDARHRALCELNVIEQVRNVARTPVLAAAWARSQPLMLHGWIYGLKDGRLRDLGVSIDDPRHLEVALDRAVAASTRRLRAHGDPQLLPLERFALAGLQALSGKLIPPSPTPLPAR